MKNIMSVLIISLIATLTIGCTSTDQSPNSDADLTIYTTIYPIQFAVERIGGESVTVKTVYPPGVDAHTYEPTSKTMTEVARSDAFIYLGAGMEGFAENMASALASQDISIVELGTDEDLFHSELVEHDETEQENENHEGHSHSDHDPHIWLDPLRMLDMSELVLNILSDLNPNKASKYKENFTTLQNELIELDDLYRQTLQQKTNKKLLVSHAAFGYWEERYGLEQLSIHGLSSGNVPSQKELTEIIEEAEENNLEYIIFEQNSSNRVSEIIQDHLHMKELIIHNLAVLMENDMESNEDYLSLMEQNLEVLDKATN
ncbi:metal ABC transporter solute-binding protein, Zn/Mn family [Ornithinibacillus salinisoli]|uniref:Metal ABC transporter solute-binding protein, Zn/Mn family n=1 Tax=Ornithinibacillus salinisoli TaxID=1848459 RepID=A0ABW4VZU3_9BACI